MNAQEYRDGFDSFLKMLGDSHQEWWQVWQDDFHQERQRWLSEFVIGAYGCLNGPAKFIEVRLGRSLGTSADLDLIVFDAGSVVRAEGQFGLDPDTRGGTKKFDIFPRSAIRAITGVEVRNARNPEADFPGHATATVDYGDFGSIALGRWDAKAAREVDSQFARFLPSLLADLAAVRR